MSVMNTRQGRGGPLRGTTRGTFLTDNALNCKTFCRETSLDHGAKAVDREDMQHVTETFP
jgi:hypothetical protein